MTLQKKYISHICTLASNYSFTPVQNEVHGNTGFISIELEKVMGSQAKIGYNFQDSKVTFAISIQGERVPSQDGKTDYFDFLIKYDDVNGFGEFEDRLHAELAALSSTLGLQESPHEKSVKELLLHYPKAELATKDNVKKGSVLCNDLRCGLMIVTQEMLDFGSDFQYFYVIGHATMQDLIDDSQSQ
ncbi:hypothetical protein A1QO_02570 [Vibrio genomosp. F10 str. ZF-129]|uniref:Uncharacterized protein n=1 Tax=Vibrio genomosp. F10 str. ZF-129 TaxID=1187848 RepID=A0A1E5BK82_9VIBR|nr:hypothetical protein [Vibrio genomosp. F10]OEE38281.1 hypothetical protein A1QO_02570 [Vibrio genomosp. F10 str. ZF-129]